MVTGWRAAQIDENRPWSLDALEMGICGTVGRTRATTFSGLMHHSDAG
jgi:hypothetical protein